MVTGYWYGTLLVVLPDILVLPYFSTGKFKHVIIILLLPVAGHTGVL